jgi:hypothetical protein
MILRRPSARTGRPSLIGTAARTAVVAGTASAVAGSVSRGQQARAEQAAQAQVFQQQAVAQQTAIDQAVAQQLAAQQAATPAPAAPVGPPQPDIIGQLTQLAALRDQGVLTDAEFEAQKARILAQ